MDSPASVTEASDKPAAPIAPSVLSGPMVVRSPNWLGDAIMAMPAVRNLKKLIGNAPLTVATPAKLLDLWSACPFVDRVLALDRPRHLWNTAHQLRAGKFGTAVLLTNSFRTAAEATLGWIPMTVGYPGHSRRWLLDRVIDRPKYSAVRAHHQFAYLDLVAALGALEDNSFPILRRPAVEFQENRLSVFPGAEYGPAKRWPPHYFCEIAKRFREERNAQVVIMGARKDCPVAAEIIELLPWAENKTGQTTLAEVMAEIARSRLVLCNDSGAMHLAAALGTATAAIFGSTEPSRTGPLGTRAVVLRRHVPCSPCFLRECSIDFACMNTLTPDLAWPDCLRLWDSAVPHSA